MGTRVASSSELTRTRRPTQADRTFGYASERDRQLHEIRELAYLLDRSFRIPVVGYRFGVDAILGLVPVLGDFSAFTLSGYIIYRAARMGAPTALLVRMVLNALGDAIVGSIPILGTIVDVVWKANSRNLQMLERFLAQRAGHA